MLSLLYSLCYKNAKCQRWINLTCNSLFWNTYIRFWLESYLEFSIACLLRFRRFSFASASESFNSLFAAVIATTLVLLLIGSIIMLQCKSADSSRNIANSRYSELTLGLKTHERASMLSPTIFMALRLIYAYILVQWSSSQSA